MTFRDLLTKEIGLERDLNNQYNTYIPKFIKEAKTGKNCTEWDSDILNKFFRAGKDHPVASLRQGNFLKEEQIKIKEHWAELAPLLKILAENQDEPQFEIYEKVKDFCRKYTSQNRRAAQHRIIASFQPKLLSTMISEAHLKLMFEKLKGYQADHPLADYIKKTNSSIENNLNLWKFYLENFPENNYDQMNSWPWQTYEYFEKNNRIEESVKLLKYKHQIILQGAPGTGKTYNAKLIAEELVKGNEDGLKNKDKYIKLIQFHPSYSYEDFVRGIVVNSNDDGQLEYVNKNKILGEFAKEAWEDIKSNNYVLIIDEINRANLPAVLGELIYALEYRGEKVESMYDIDGDREFCLPENLYIIGTMNTADRSVGEIDYAIRRRFSFVEMLPRALSDGTSFAMDLFKSVSNLFIENIEDYIKDQSTSLKPSEYLSSDFRPEDVWIGHSYFILKKNKKNKENKEKTEEEENRRLKYEILPILKEYIKDGILRKSAEDEIKKILEKSENKNKSKSKND